MGIRNAVGQITILNERILHQRSGMVETFNSSQIIKNALTMSKRLCT